MSDNPQSLTGALQRATNGAPVHQSICLECWEYAKTWVTLDEKLQGYSQGLRAEYELTYREVHIDKVAGGEHFYRAKTKTKRKAGKLLSLPLRPPTQREA